MGKLPYFPFFPNDWSRDLEEHPLEIEGAWIRICCKLWYAEQRGQLTRTWEQWAKILRKDEDESKRIISYILQWKIADGNVDGNGEVTVISRRMKREEKDREFNRLRQQRYKHKQRGNGEITPPVTQNKRQNNKDLHIHSSYSYSNNIKEKNIKKRKVLDLESPKFEEWWKSYPKRNGVKIGKSECKAFFLKEIKETDYLDLITATNNYANSKQAKEGYAIDPIRYLKRELWKDWVQVDETKQDIPLDYPEYKAPDWMKDAIKTRWKD